MTDEVIMVLTKFADKTSPHHHAAHQHLSLVLNDGLALLSPHPCLKNTVACLVVPDTLEARAG